MAGFVVTQLIYVLSKSIIGTVRVNVGGSVRKIFDILNNFYRKFEVSFS